MAPFQDKNVWLSVIELLRKTDKLPVIAFVFSKRRLEDYLSKLQSVDLTTKQEKSHIHTFFAKCIKRLKGNDQQLFQVGEMICDECGVGLLWGEDVCVCVN